MPMVQEPQSSRLPSSSSWLSTSPAAAIANTDRTGFSTGRAFVSSGQIMPRHIPLAEVRRLHQQHHLFAMLSAWCRKTCLIFCEIKHWHVMYVYAPPACLQLRSRVVAPSKHHGTPCPNISFHFHKMQQSPSKQFRTYKLHHRDVFLF